METKHTPGPWVVSTGTVQLHVYGTAHICSVGTGEYDRNKPIGTPTEHANARLIAAAPELLHYAKAADAWEILNKKPDGVSARELDEFARAWDVPLNQRIGPWLREVRRAAIAKATGHALSIPAASAGGAA